MAFTNKLVYLDTAATTQPHPKVVEVMLKYLTENYGNPSSVHKFGSTVRNAIEEARELIANEINADAGEIYFTGGGTESDNFTIRGLALESSFNSKKYDIVSSLLEHHAVLDSISFLEKFGFNFIKVPINYDGNIDNNTYRGLLNNNTLLVSFMHVNNEIGVINDITKLNEIAKEKGIYTHSDCVQSFGKYKIDVKKMNLDLFCANAHKINGPKGIGFAYIKSGTPIKPLIVGGSQERNRRGGTENVAGILGLAEAIKIFSENREYYFLHVSNIKKHFVNLLSGLEGIFINGGENTSPYILSISLNPEMYKTDTESILVFLDINGIAASSGSACMSGSVKPSHVITALGKGDEYAKGTIRFSFDYNTTITDIDYTVEILSKLLKQIKRK
ncbi:MAG TPA: cysteine desulfurase family protein [Melioribacteraceae bacterium]|nr:cysteine desulfurase family protein [Melioribacteraceae bacterium]